MANKQVLSVVAASILAAAFTFTGCGNDEDPKPSSSSSSVVSSSSVSSDSSSSVSSDSSSSVSSDSSSSVSSSSSSAPTGSTTVKVSDAYVIGATVTIGGTALEIEADDGLYETAEDNITGQIVAMNGYNDLNANNVVDVKADENTTDYDVVAMTLTAPSGYANVNPFTTLLDSGLTMENAAKIFPIASAIVTDNAFDFDVVAESDVANEVLIAVLTVQNGTGSAAKVRAILPDKSSSAGASSSAAPVAEDCTFDPSGILPGNSDEPISCDGLTFPTSNEINAINAMSTEELTAAFRNNFAAATEDASSSSECAEGVLPEDCNPKSSSSVAESSSSAATSSEAGVLP